MRNRTLCLVTLAIALSGCGLARVQEQRERQAAAMNATVGKSVDEVVRLLGPPTNTAALSTGGAVLEWARTNQVGGGGGSFTTYASTYVAGQWVSVPQQHQAPTYSNTRHCSILVVATPQRTVESWKTQGDC